MSRIPFVPVRLLVSAVLTVSILSYFFSLKSWAQTSLVAEARPVADRLTLPVDEKVRATLARTVHPLAKPSNDRGVAPDSMKLDRLEVRFKRSDAQEASLKQLIDQMHTTGAASYHKWLTPQQFGQRFGPSEGDIAKIEGWLQSHGFAITKLNPGRQTLEFSGTAGQFRDTFHTPIHAYQVDGQTHYANASDPQIPAALAPVFAGFVSLNNFHLKSQIKKKGTATYDPVTHATKPSWTIGSSYYQSFLLAPGDFAVQYDLNPLYTATTPINGDGQAIAIINDANIDIALVNRFRSLFSLPVNPPQVIIDGNDPGVDGFNNPYGPNYDSIEAYLDVEWAGAVAPNATIDLVIAANTALGDGLSLAAERAVYSNIAPVISVSFGNCEASLGQNNQFWGYLWEQAAAQGITVAVSTGDSGSAACDSQYNSYAVRGEAINGLASTPYNVAIGGTDFYYSDYNASSSVLNTQVDSFWNITPSNNAPAVSLLSPIPEQPWNDSQFGLNATGFTTDYSTTAAGSGGPSSCATGTTDSNGNFTCTAGYAKPVWQTGTGVPSDTVRDIPDVSLFAADGSNYSFYPICYYDGDCQPVANNGYVQISGVGGTSASTPAFAGIMALVNQKYGRQGQANYVLYPLATQFPSAFHDVVNGTNSVPCNTTTVTDYNGNSYAPVDCLPVDSPFNLTVDDYEYGTTVEGQVGRDSVAAYNTGTGYDLATGLGTIDAAKLVANWGSVKPSGASTTTLTPSSTSFTHGTTVTFSGSVTPPSGGPTPTGDVALMATSTEYAEQSQTFFTLSSGAFSQSVSSLPGGTYDVWGNYPGDGNTPASSSTPVSITVTPEASTTTFNLYSYNIVSLSSGASILYGSASMTARPKPASSSSAFSVATGTVVFADNSTPFNSAVINDNGTAANTYAFSPGPHSVTAAFSGDNSYQPSTSSPFSFTVSKATPYFEIDYYSFYNLYAGQGGVIPLRLGNPNSNGNALLSPTGAVTVSGGPAGTTSSATLSSSTLYGSQTQSVALFTVPTSAAPGTYNFTFTYPGDANYAAASATYTITVNAASGLTSSVSASASPATTSPAAAVLATATVTGQPGHPAPTGLLYFEAAGDIFAAYGLPSSSSDSVTVSILLGSENLPQGVNQVQVLYFGDSNYQPSQTTFTLDNSHGDFSLVPLSTLVTMPSSGAVTQTVNISSYSSFAGPVFLSCAGASGITCSIVPSVMLSSGATVPAVLTVNTSGITAAGTYNLVVTGVDSTGAYVHNIGLQIVTTVITTPRQGPIGNLELAVDNATKSTTVSQADALFVSGWAADPTDGAPLADVKIYLDGILLGTPTLGLPRSDVASSFNNSAYANSGFNLSYNAVNLYAGPHKVQVVAIDAAGLATSFGTLYITVKPVAGPPLGNLEIVADNLTGSATVSQSDRVAVSGWVADPADGSPVANVKVYLDGASLGAPTLGIARPDVAVYLHNNAYANAGFATSYYAGNLAAGSHSVSVVATDSGGQSTTFGPSTFNVVAQSAAPPVGNLEHAVDSVTAQSTIAPSGTLFVSGWAADYHDNGPAKSVQILVDGTAAGLATLGQPRPDVASVYNNPAWTNSGYSFNMSVAALSLGAHTVTVIATDSLGVTTTFGPITFTIDGTISTVAGSGVGGEYSGDGGPATSAVLHLPAGVAVDGAGNIYIADTYNHVIRKVALSGVITTVAGTGTSGYSGDGGPAISAQLYYPYGVAVDSSGDIYIADYGNSLIRKVTPTGTISTVAGTVGFNGYSGDGGPATDAKLYAPSGVAFDSSGNLYIADSANCVIRKVLATGVITTIVGNRTCGYTGDGGSATAAELNFPTAIAVDGSGNIFIDDYRNFVVRKVMSAGTISTYAGNGTAGYSGDGELATSAELNYPFGVALDGGGNLFIGDAYNQRIRKVTPAGTITTAAGNGTVGFAGDGGPATSAVLAYPQGVAFDSSGNLFICDSSTGRIRKVTYSAAASGSSTPAVLPVLANRPTPAAAPLSKPVLKPQGNSD